MTIFLNMVLKEEGAVYPSVFLKLENGEEITLTYVQYIYTSPNSKLLICRVNTDLGICENETYKNVKWIQVLD